MKKIVKEKKIQIVKNKDGRFLIGQGGAHKEAYRLNIPFEIVKTPEGVTITPYDVDIVDTYIPYIDFYEYEYIVEPELGLCEFYINTSETFVKEVKFRVENRDVPGIIEEQIKTNQAAEDNSE